MRQRERGCACGWIFSGSLFAIILKEGNSVSGMNSQPDHLTLENFCGGTSFKPSQNSIYISGNNGSRQNFEKPNTCNEAKISQWYQSCCLHHDSSTASKIIEISVICVNVLQDDTRRQNGHRTLFSRLEPTVESTYVSY